MSLAEIMVVLILVLVFVGPERLPDVARVIGKGLREIRRATNLFRDTMRVDEDFDLDSLDQRPAAGPIDESDPQDHAIESVPRPQSSGGSRRTRLFADPITLAESRHDLQRVPLTQIDSSSAVRRVFVPMPHREISSSQ